MYKRNRWFVLLAMLCAAAANASQWNTQDYDLYPGDFNGDGKNDMLYVAKSPDKGSGIALSNGSQLIAGDIIWNSMGFGIPWHSNIYKPVIGDFNWDGRADIFLQRQTSGNHYLLISNADGSFSGIAQEIPNVYASQTWSGDEHRILSVKAFNSADSAHPRGHRLFLQAVKKGGANALIATSNTGLIGGVSGTPWTDGYQGFQWNLSQAIVYSGDFNGDGQGDLFIQAKPDFILINYEVAIPVPQYRPGSFGIVFATFGSGGVQFWDRLRSGVDWSTNSSNIVIGNFTSSNRDEVLVQAKQSGGATRLVTVNPNGPGLLLDSSSLLTFSGAGSATGDAYRLLSVNVGGSYTSGVYLQSTSPGGTDLIASQIPTSGGTAATVAQNSEYQYSPTPGTAVGAIPGQFGVDASGAATYQIPIDIPPGIAGVKPSLSLSYSSRAGNGLLGVGWSLSGLSAITRCGTVYETDGFTDGVDFDDSDRYCLDGQRLVPNGYPNGAVNALYRTEIETFQDVHSYNGGANDPLGWYVRDKAGLTRYYGYTADSRMEPQGRSQASTWSVNKIVDRYNNFIEFTYTESMSESSFAPADIVWGSEANGRNVVGRVHFEYSTNRPDVVTGYFAGGFVRNTKRLQRIEVFSRASATTLSSAATTPVRTYYVNYQQNAATMLSHVREIILCDSGGASAQRCVGSTKFQIQPGLDGFGSAVDTNLKADQNPYLRPININSDGRTDYLVGFAPYFTGGVLAGYGLSAGFASYNMYVDTHSSASTPGEPWNIISMDYDSDGYDDLVLNSGGNYEVVKGSANGIQASQPPVATSVPAQAVSHGNTLTAVGDFDGDGTQDLIYSQPDMPTNTYYNNAPMNSLLSLHLNQPGGFATQSSSNLKTIALGGTALVSAGFGSWNWPHKGDQASMVVINFDGDGRDDLLVRVGTSCTRARTPIPAPSHSYQCTGNTYNVYSYDPSTASLVLVWQAGDVEWQYPKFADFNGDGLTDVLYATGSGWNMRLGTGSAVQGLKLEWTRPGYEAAGCVPSGGTTEGGQPEMSCGNQSGFGLTADKLRYAQAVDYDRDGVADILFPHNDGTIYVPPTISWVMFKSVGGVFPTRPQLTGIPADIPESAMIVDANGDTLPDLLYRTAISGASLSNNILVAYGRGSVPGLLTRITDGLGAFTQVQHVALTAAAAENLVSQFYGGHTDFLDNLSANKTVSFPYTHVAAPFNVVSQISQDNGVGASGSITTGYQYQGLKMHRRGRGLLGFSRIVTRNGNTNIETVREFAQRWPYTGLPLYTAQRHPETVTVQNIPISTGSNGYANCGPYACPPPISLISTPTLTAARNITTSTNVLSYLSWPAPSQRWFPQILQTVETVHPVNGGAALKRTTTDYLAHGGTQQGSAGNAHDDYGNPNYIRVTVDNGAGGDAHVTNSEHWYTNDTADWCLGRLYETQVAHSKSLGLTGNTGAQSINRKSTFTYTAAPKCSLEKETIEPDNNAVKQLTTYSYDSYGNRSSALTQVFDASAPASRTVSTSYISTQGQFPSSITNALGHVETSTWDARYGTKTDSTGPNGISSHVDYDGFGRALYETPISGVSGGGAGLGITRTTNRYWCAYSGCYDSRSVMVVIVTGSDGSQSRAELDRLGRETHSGKVALDGRWLFSEKHYDPLGRNYAASQPYFDSSKKCWTFNRFDLLNRVVYQRSAYKTGDNSDSECMASVPIYDAADAALPGGANGGRVSTTTYDYQDGSLIGAKVVSNSGNAIAQRVAYKWVDVVGRTRAVQDEASSGGCNGTATAGNSGCLATFYDHDAQGNLTLIRRTGALANGSSTTNTTIDTHVSFNVRGFKIGMNDPDMGIWSYAYNGFGELISQTDAKQQTTVLTYDLLGRLKTRTEGSEGPTTFYYDEVSYGGPKSIGKLTRVTAPGGFEERYSYDNYGRAETTKRLIDGNWYRIDQTYDSQSRVDVLKYPSWVSSTDPNTVPADTDRVRVQNSYNAYGYLTSTQNVGTGTTLWRADTIDLYGVTQETLGNGVITRRTFEATTGYLRQVQAGLGSATTVQNQSFTFDRNGNVLMRGDVNVSRSEDFTYDAIDRLTQTRLFNNATANGAVLSSETMFYDGFGNIKTKGASYGSYDYAVDTVSTCGARSSYQGSQPHAVRRLTAAASTRTLCYDANGNVVSQQNGQYDSATWSVANLAKHIAKGSNYADFSYGPDRARFKQVANVAGVSTTTLYVGGVYEKATKGSVVEHTYYLKGGGGAVAIHKRTTSGGNTTLLTKYLHRDHLGSVVALSDEMGVVAAADRMSFDAWGKRRTNTWTATPAGTQIATSLYSSFTNRGYTGHEQLDFLGVIHMNGRVYDSEIGRFLSADPFVQFPESTQGFNRYSYVDNNPLTHTDPSGFLSLRQIVGMAAGIIGSFLGAPMLWAAIGGYVNGGGQGAALGFISAGIFTEVVPYISNLAIVRAIVSGVAGGMLSVAAGGHFGDGFIGGFASSAAGNIKGIEYVAGETGANIARFIFRTVLGGTISEISGGSFANGAIAAAFQAAVDVNAEQVELNGDTASTASSEEVEASQILTQERQKEIKDVKILIVDDGGHETFEKAASASLLYPSNDAMYLSTTNKQEITGLYFKNEENGRYYFTEAVNTRSGNFKAHLIPVVPGSITGKLTAVGDYHSHPFTLGKNQESFSKGDNDAFKYTRVLRTPRGDIRVLYAPQPIVLEGQGVPGVSICPTVPCLKLHPRVR